MPAITKTTASPIALGVDEILSESMTLAELQSFIDEATTAGIPSTSHVLITAHVKYPGRAPSDQALALRSITIQN